MGHLTRANAFLGYFGSGSYNNNYWIGPTTGVTTGSYATLINTTIDATTNTKYPGFDFTNVWDIDTGHSTPFLRNLAIPGNIYIN
jgi:hypothetical protein